MMTKKILILLLLVGVMIPAISNASVRVGEEAPDFTLIDSDGNQFNLMSKKGKTVVLFWMGYS